MIGREARAQFLELSRRAARRGGRLRRRRQQRHRHLRRVHRRRRRAADRRRGRRRGDRRRAATPRASPAAPRACCRARAPSCCRTPTATSSRRIRCRPASTTRRSAPSTRGCGRSGRAEYHAASDERGARRRFRRWRGSKASCRRSSRRTPSPTCRRSAAGVRRRTPCSLVNLSGRGDKDVDSVAAAASKDERDAAH